ncbi:hypothetical protein LshimejAT787_0700970 [Lyophyllum shimeji]|uniref:Tyr recombinase domain-containing protein n=1 Tax=Lyophyllum shimeji TaxID=47721 RepID=A0A9P3PQL4_LYOSH|nr:hypothetical protein LshimejAT787_0700970 [Lyophyllum shimeji]
MSTPARAASHIEGAEEWYEKMFANTADHRNANTPQEDIDRVVNTLAQGYADGTKESYGSGLLAWHVWWRPDDDELDLMLKAGDKLTPPTSKHKQRLPYTIQFILKLREQMDLNNPFDVAVLACLACLIYSASRVGDFTVRRLDAFDTSTHVSRRCLRRDQDRSGKKVTVLHLPCTKSAPQGEDVYWSAQTGLTDPEAALDHHLEVNQPPEDGHLFAYKWKNRYRALTKTAFVKRLAALARQAGLDPLQRHGIRVGATLEYLLRGVPFEVMNVMGHWQRDAFTLYLRKHALILAPYIQAQAPQVYDEVVRITMPPVR